MHMWITVTTKEIFLLPETEVTGNLIKFHTFYLDVTLALCFKKTSETKWDRKLSFAGSL